MPSLPVIATQDREIIALRAAADAGSIWPDFGSLTAPIYAVAGGAIGYGLGRLAR